MEGLSSLFLPLPLPHRLLLSMFLHPLLPLHICLHVSLRLHVCVFDSLLRLTPLYLALYFFDSVYLYFTSEPVSTCLSIYAPLPTSLSASPPFLFHSLPLHLCQLVSLSMHLCLLVSLLPPCWFHSTSPRLSTCLSTSAPLLISRFTSATIICLHVRSPLHLCLI